MIAAIPKEQRMAAVARFYGQAKDKYDVTPRYRIIRRYQLRDEMRVWARSHVEIYLGMRY